MVSLKICALGGRVTAALATVLLQRVCPRRCIRMRRDDFERKAELACREGRAVFPRAMQVNEWEARRLYVQPSRRSACDRKRQDRTMARLATDLGGTRCYARRVAVHVTPAGESDGLCSERLAIRFPAHLRLRFRIRATAGLRRAGVGVRMMAFRYTPREASQFTHSCDLFGGPLLASLGLLLLCRAGFGVPYFCPPDRLRGHRRH